MTLIIDHVRALAPDDVKTKLDDIVLPDINPNNALAFFNRGEDKDTPQRDTSTNIRDINH